MGLKDLQELCVVLQLSADHKQHQIQAFHFSRTIPIRHIDLGTFDETRRREVQQDMMKVTDYITIICAAVDKANRKLLTADVEKMVKKTEEGLAAEGVSTRMQTSARLKIPANNLWMILSMILIIRYYMKSIL